MNPLTQREYSNRYKDILKTRKKLPVWNLRDQIVEIVKRNQVSVLMGDTGSGKTTQIPQFVFEDLGFIGTKGRIAVTQPRRIAATSVAARVAEEMDVELGEQVGYSVRFDEKSSDKTVIKYVTDGMLLREATLDPLFSRYDLIIIDEAHERTLATDILMGLLKTLCTTTRKLGTKNPLRLIVMSATLDSETFSTYFDNAPTLKMPGRAFPVEIVYSQTINEDYVKASIDMAVNILKKEDEGDILIFLTGQEEIDEVCTQLKQITIAQKNHPRVGTVNVIPLYSTLSPFMQQKVFMKPPSHGPGSKIGRKIIVSTNIAETSVTIDGVVFVIDCGLSKQKVYNARLNAESLMVTPISKASADQRAGRAGRTKPGKCFRLYTKAAYEELVDHSPPAIQTTNIASVVLQLRKIGVQDLIRFDFIAPPSPETMMRGLEVLLFIKALDENAELTKRGKLMAVFPLDPEFCAPILQAVDIATSSKDLDLVVAVTIIIAMVSVQPPFVRPPFKQKEADAAHSYFHHRSGDHFTLLLLFLKYKMVLRANEEKSPGPDGRNAVEDWCYKHFVSSKTLSFGDNVLSQLLRIMKKLKLVPDAMEYDLDVLMKRVYSDEALQRNVIKCLLAGFFMKTAKRKDKVYVTWADHQTVLIHPSSCLRDKKPEIVLFQEHTLTSKHYMRTVTDVLDENLFKKAVPREWYNQSVTAASETQTRK